jgi:hypothetical protein
MMNKTIQKSNIWRTTQSIFIAKMVQNALLEMHPENLHTISDRIIIILFGSYFLFGSVQAQNAQKVSKNILKMIFGMQHYFKPAR